MKTFTFKQLGHGHFSNLNNDLYGMSVIFFYGIDGKYRDISGTVVAEKITNKPKNIW